MNIAGSEENFIIRPRTRATWKVIMYRKPHKNTTKKTYEKLLVHCGVVLGRGHDHASACTGPGASAGRSPFPSVCASAGVGTGTGA